MDLKGAKIVNFYHISGDVQTNNIDVNKVKIPHYQRPYSWDKDMVKQLIEDWHQQDEQEYFAGSVVTVAYPAEKTHELVDGQQRFTTIFLINYVLFLLLRVTVRQAIIQSKMVHIKTLSDELEKTKKHLYENAKGDSLTGLASKVEQIEEFKDQLKESERGKLTAYFRKQIGLPDLYEGSDEYIDDYREQLKTYINHSKLLLTYDRKSFNGELLSALSKVLVTMTDQNEPRLKIIEENITIVEKQYLNAIEQIFASFKDLSSESRPFDIARSMSEKMISFLSELKLCVVQTGNHKDAYTLFEVLNDRSMALADLDLIKNQFYKQYCLKSGEADDVIDKNIELCESQWGDQIYNESADYKKKFITFFSTVYLTGSTSIGYNQNDIYRKKIKNYLDDKSKYESKDIKIDFNIFQTCSLLVNLFNLRHSELEKLALEAEYDKDKSAVYKTVHLLMGLKYHAVLAGLFNLILKYIEKNICSEFTFEKVEKFIKDLKCNTSKDKYSLLNKQAVKISQLSLLNKDFKKAKDFSNKLINNNNRSSLDIYFADDTPLNDSNRDAFYTWIDSWQYGSNFKIRIFFAKLLPTSIENDKLEIKDIQLGIAINDVARLQLDHMEPRKPDSNNLPAYFDDESRDFHVNSLGNMFPLLDTQNMNKSNQPFMKAFKYIQESGLKDHWITKKTEVIFEKNNNNNVPKVDFFTKRRELLKEMFYQVLKLEENFD